MTLIDLSQDIYDRMPRHPILPEVEVSCLFRIAEGKPLNISQLRIATHAGSHIDAPYHAFEHGRTIDQIPLDTFVGRGALITVQRGGGEAITAADLENSGVAVERGDILLIRTGWDARFTSPDYLMHPYLAEEACRWIVERGVKLVALDCLSPDLPVALRPPDFAYPAHRTLLGHDIPIIENLCNFGALEGRRFRFIALPLRVRGGDAGHTRAVAELL
ncbi:MAG TPA: cyclase family protein [Chloroflexota bacterium]|nr:cyclase family protein [Chloroflexota bacterium]